MNEALEHLILPRTRDLGDGFLVRRVLPAAERRLVGPFIFFDQMGPLVVPPGQSFDVRPHPHIGLATVTYLFQGEVFHKDSLGSAQLITPGAVNWMTAGRGIVHSERSTEERRKGGGPLFGIQIWVALPKAHEETAPSFVHTPAEALPLVAAEGVLARVIAGEQFGVRSPVATLSPLFYVDVTLSPGARVQVEREHEERAVYVVEGRVRVGDDVFEPGQLLILRPKADVVLTSEAGAKVLLFGGEPMDGPRHIYWNFVSSSKERIEAAKSDWRERRMTSVPGDPERVELPDDKLRLK